MAYAGHNITEHISENVSKSDCVKLEDGFSSSSSECLNEDLDATNEGSLPEVLPYARPPTLGLIDDEGTLILPPEDPGELSDKELDETTDSVDFTRKSIRRVARRFGFREVGEDEDWNVYWTDYSVSLDRVVVLRTWQKINHFPGMSEICRKDSLARNLNRMSKAFPKEYAIYPKTWILPSEWNELQTYGRKHKSRTYIAKPDTGCQGKGIIITRYAKEIRPMENMICQVYLSKPFLIDGYKFDMRLYVLLTSCDPLRVLLFRDGLVRFTTVPYVEPHTKNIHNMYMHLTNYAVQKHSDGYIRDDEDGGTKRRITTLNRWFLQNGYDLDKIWNDVDDVVIKTILSGYAVLRHNYRTCFPNHVQASACFEVLGFDIMFNHKLKPYVLEVNHSPSFGTDSRLDKEIKDAMLWDAFQLAHFGMLSKKKCLEDERKRIRNRLLNKTAKKEIRELNEQEIALSVASAVRYENSHLGNFRVIFPRPNQEKYEQFINPTASFYQETMTYKVRTECARQMREEIRLKQEKLESLQPQKNRTAVPESPAPKKLITTKSDGSRPPLPKTSSGSKTSTPSLRTVSSAVVPSKSVNESLVQPESVSGNEDKPFVIRARSSIPSWLPRPICALEEAERQELLRQRERLMRSLGVIEAVHRLLANSPGVSTCAPLSDEIHRRSQTKGHGDSIPDYHLTRVSGQKRHVKSRFGSHESISATNGMAHVPVCRSTFVPSQTMALSMSAKLPRGRCQLDHLNPRHTLRSLPLGEHDLMSVIGQQPSTPNSNKPHANTMPRYGSAQRFSPKVASANSNSMKRLFRATSTNAPSATTTTTSNINNPSVTKTRQEFKPIPVVSQYDMLNVFCRGLAQQTPGLTGVNASQQRSGPTSAGRLRSAKQPSSLAVGPDDDSQGRGLLDSMIRTPSQMMTVHASAASEASGGAVTTLERIDRMRLRYTGTNNVNTSLWHSGDEQSRSLHMPRVQTIKDKFRKSCTLSKLTDSSGMQTVSGAHQLLVTKRDELSERPRRPDPDDHAGAEGHSPASSTEPPQRPPGMPCG